MNLEMLCTRYHDHLRKGGNQVQARGFTKNAFAMVSLPLIFRLNPSHRIDSSERIVQAIDRLRITNARGLPSHQIDGNITFAGFLSRTIRPSTPASLPRCLRSPSTTSRPAESPASLEIPARCPERRIPRRAKMSSSSRRCAKVCGPTGARRTRCETSNSALAASWGGSRRDWARRGENWEFEMLFFSSCGETEGQMCSRRQSSACDERISCTRMAAA